MTYFWRHGYEGTHMRDLADYMGISKSSFYNTYGDKHQVYISALNSYLEQEYAGLNKLLESDPSTGCACCPPCTSTSRPVPALRN